MESINESVSNLSVHNDRVLTSNSTYINCQQQNSASHNASMNVGISDKGNLCVSHSQGPIASEMEDSLDANTTNLVMHIEVCLSPRCTEFFSQIEKKVQDYLATLQWRQFKFLRESSENG